MIRELVSLVCFCDMPLSIFRTPVLENQERALTVNSMGIERDGWERVTAATAAPHLLSIGHLCTSLFQHSNEYGTIIVGAAGRGRCGNEKKFTKVKDGYNSDDDDELLPINLPP